MARHNITWEDFNQETVVRHSDDQVLRFVTDQPLSDRGHDLVAAP